MKALIWTAAETMIYGEKKKPLPLPGEVLIQVLVVGICGSEIEGYLGHNSLRIPPLVMGHEFCGYVAQIGEGVSDTSLRTGMKVVVNPLLYCGKCPSCVKGLTQLCKQRSIVGIHRPGAFAQWVSVPHAAVIPVPQELKASRACLAEPLACSLRATRRALQYHPFSQVLVFGAGGIGLLCAKVAKLLGAETVIVADTNQERLNIAKQVCADHVINPQKQTLEAYLGSIVGERGIDVVIDAAGFQPTRETAMRVINPGGTFMNVGLGIDETKLPINHLIRSEIEILGSFCYTAKDFEDAVRLLVNGSVTEEGWTEKRDLAEGVEAFADLVAGVVVNGKILLKVAGGEWE